MKRKQKKTEKNGNARMHKKQSIMKNQRIHADYCIRQSPFSFYSIYIGLIAFSFGMWVYIARFINIF